MLIQALDIIGTFFFCLSGALAGRQKGFDLWGLFILALITGTGGGTLRSLLIGQFPVPILTSPVYILLAALSVPCAVCLPQLWDKLKREISIIDAIGLGLFAGVGTQVAQQAGLEWWAAIGMGAVSATFGGLLRDVVRNEIPLILRKEIYATAALLGGGISLTMQSLGLDVTFSILSCVVVTAVIRLLAIRYAINASSN